MVDRSLLRLCRTNPIAPANLDILGGFDEELRTEIQSEISTACWVEVFCRTSRRIRGVWRRAHPQTDTIDI
jgi:hypothetical protein